MKNVTADPMVDRLVTFAWRLLEGETADLRRVLEAGGAKYWEYGTTRVVERSDGLNVGLHASDPSTAIVMVNFAVFGAQWATVPEACAAMKRVNNEAKTRRKGGEHWQRKAKRIVAWELPS